MNNYELPTTPAVEKENIISVESVYGKIVQLEPKPVAAFVPRDATEQKALFLSGQTQNPAHAYDKLMNLTPAEDRQKIKELSSSLEDLLPKDSTEYLAYSQYAERYMNLQEMLEMAQNVHLDDIELSDEARERFMELNERLYGAPEEDTYRSLLYESIKTDVPSDVQHIKDDLIARLPDVGEKDERFIPSEQTISNMHEIAEYMYGGMLSHIPEDKDSFIPDEVAEIFRNIITDEFGGAAADWRVEVADAASINVIASDKLIKIPKNRKHMNTETLRGLIAHELGVHMLRSIAGGDTDLPVLKTGLNDYYDSEEGLGKVMEQAVNGKFVESGVPYYLIAGLMYFDKKDFRDTYEIMWRIKYLEAVGKGDVADESTETAAKDGAYKSVFRITRGTDSLPWFKDLAYYNGTSKMWRYLENTRGDYEEFMLIFLGKADPARYEHRRILLETSSP